MTLAPPIEPGEVHLWRLPLDLPPHRRAALRCLLSPDEQVRAQRLRVPEARRRFLLARGLLRETLACYHGVAPELLEFSYGSAGKPALAGHFAQTGLRFNLSHVDDFALLAVARNHELGVDVERVRHVDHSDRIASSFFSPHQQIRWREAPPHCRLETFFRCWTRMEATAKASGVGITAEPPDPYPWTYYELDPAPGLVATLAIEGVAHRVLVVDRPQGA